MAVKKYFQFFRRRFCQLIPTGININPGQSVLRADPSSIHNYDMVIEALVDAALINEETVNLKYFRNDLRDISEPFYGRSLKNKIKEN